MQRSTQTLHFIDVAKLMPHKYERNIEKLVRFGFDFSVRLSPSKVHCGKGCVIICCHFPFNELLFNAETPRKIA